MAVSVITGEESGKQRLLKDEFGENVSYIHCSAHKLNLAFKHAAEANKPMYDRIEKVF